MTVRELIKLLEKKDPNDRVGVQGILNYPFQHAPVKSIEDNEKGTIWINILNQ